MPVTEAALRDEAGCYGKAPDADALARFEEATRRALGLDRAHPEPKPDHKEIAAWASARALVARYGYEDVKPAKPAKVTKPAEPTRDELRGAAHRLYLALWAVDQRADIRTAVAAINRDAARLADAIDPPTYFNGETEPEPELRKGRDRHYARRPPEPPWR
jgi:hypothetical protein